jgi:hypothetical protein
MDKSSTLTNSVGVAIIWWGTLTNDNEIEYNQFKDYKITSIGKLQQIGSDEFQNEGTALTSDVKLAAMVDHEQEVIVGFASKLMRSAKDIDPEIAKVIQNRFWDMV